MIFIALSFSITALSNLYSQRSAHWQVLIYGNKTAGGAVLNCESSPLRKIDLAQMDALNNFSRWLTRNDNHAEDVVQEAPFRNGKRFDDFRITDSTTSLKEKDRLARFEQSILPHMDAAYNLARWLTRNDDDAKDMVQEAYLRAFKFFDAFRGVDGRAWLLTIVRNTCYTWLQQNRGHETTMLFDEEIHSPDGDTSNPATCCSLEIPKSFPPKVKPIRPLGFPQPLAWR